MPQTESLTFVGRIDFAGKVLLAIGAAIRSLITYPFSTTGTAKTRLKQVSYAFFRTLTSRITPAQEQLLVVPTTEVYRDFAKWKKLECVIDELDHGVQACWLGKKDAAKVILFFHGGGFVTGASPGHLSWVFELQQAVATGSAQDVSIVVVAYTLAPIAQYPEQLRQAATTLQWVLGDLQKRPSDILLLGDSAGAQLTLSLLRHIQHPHPAIEQRITLNGPLAGAVLISPLVNYAASSDSFARNTGGDTISAACLRRWKALYLGNSCSDPYNHPLLASRDDLQGLDMLVKDIMFWAGGSEALVEDIREMYSKVHSVHRQTALLVDEGAAHEEVIMDTLLGYPKSDTAKAIESWIVTRWG